MMTTTLPDLRNSRFQRNRHRALELFAQRGFAQVSLRELASHLELSAGSLYNHVASKEELLQEFIEEHYMALLALFERPRAEQSAEVRLAALLDDLLTLHASHPLHFQLANRELHCLAPEQRQHIEGQRQLLRERLDELLASAGYLPSGSKAVAALELLEHLPSWLAHYPLYTSRRRDALLSLLQGCVAAA